MRDKFFSREGEKLGGRKRHDREKMLASCTGGGKLLPSSFAKLSWEFRGMDIRETEGIAKLRERGKERNRYVSLFKIPSFRNRSYDLAMIGRKAKRAMSADVDRRIKRVASLRSLK